MMVSRARDECQSCVCWPWINEEDFRVLTKRLNDSVCQFHNLLIELIGRRRNRQTRNPTKSKPTSARHFVYSRRMTFGCGQISSQMLFNRFFFSRDFFSSFSTFLVIKYRFFMSPNAENIFINNKFSLINSRWAFGQLVYDRGPGPMATIGYHCQIACRW